MSFEHEGFRIYVASLSDYNAGILHGVWLDFDNFDHITDLWKAVKKMPPTIAEVLMTLCNITLLAAVMFLGLFGALLFS